MKAGFLRFFSFRQFLTFQYGDKNAYDARCDPEYQEPKEGETDAVFWWDIINGEKGDESGVPCPKAVQGDRNRGDSSCYSEHEEKGEIRDMDTEKLRDEIQLREEHDPSEKWDDEWQKKASEAGEVLVEGFDGVIHVALYELEDLGAQESLEKVFWCFLSEEEDEEEDSTE